MGPKTPKKTPSKPKVASTQAPAATDPVQSTSAGPDPPIPDPGAAADVPDVVDVSDDEEEIDLWTFYDKDPKFVKDPKEKERKYPDAICKRCKLPVPRKDAGTKGMRQHLEKRHNKSWLTLLAAEAKNAKAKVWITGYFFELLLEHAFRFPRFIPNSLEISRPNLTFPSAYPEFPRYIPTLLTFPSTYLEFPRYIPTLFHSRLRERRKKGS